MARNFDRQVAEFKVRVAVLNGCTALDIPVTKVAGKVFPGTGAVRPSADLCKNAEYDDEDAIFTGRIAGMRDGVGFHADTLDGLREAFHEAVDDDIETCARIGKEPQKSYPGRVLFRVNPEGHRKAASPAELPGRSLNQWAEDVLGRAAG